MIELRIKNQSQRPKFHVGDILDFDGCKMSYRIDFKTLWPRNGHTDSLGVNLAHFFLFSKKKGYFSNFWQQLNTNLQAEIAERITKVDDYLMRTDANLDEKIETDWCQQTTILQEKLVLIGKGFLIIFPY